MKRIAVIGMGIIGGSFCKALKKYTNHYVIGINRTQSTLQEAFDCGAIDEMGDEKSLEKADVIIMAVYPQAAIDYIRENGKHIKKGCIVTDSSGIKAEICPEMTELAKKYDFEFVGSHPMAGKEINGFGASDAELYRGASYIVVPCEAGENAVKTLCDLALEINFGGIKITTPEEHDKMIAFLSQLTHCIAVTLMTCNNDKGLEKYTGDSFRDLTRIAKINDAMWSELFLMNKDALLAQMDSFASEFSKMRQMLISDDREGLREMMRKSTERRSHFDKPTK